MLGTLKTIWSFIAGVPAFVNVFKNASNTGKIDPHEALNALVTFSPAFKKTADTASQTINSGGGIADVIRNIKNSGNTIEIMGQKINPRTLSFELRKGGGMGAVMADVLDSLDRMSEQEIVEFGEQARDINNWSGSMPN